MMTRPSTIRFRRCYVRRRSCRCCCEFFVLLVLLLLCDIRLLTAFGLSLIGLLILELFVLRRF